MLQYSDGTEIETTWNHPFYIQGRGWVEVKDLEVGDLSLTSGDTVLEITGIRMKPVPQTVYNIHLDKDHTYFVTDSDVLVHNYAEGLQEAYAYKQNAEFLQKIGNLFTRFEYASDAELIATAMDKEGITGETAMIKELGYALSDEQEEIARGIQEQSAILEEVAKNCNCYNDGSFDPQSMSKDAIAKVRQALRRIDVFEYRHEKDGFATAFEANKARYKAEGSYANIGFLDGIGERFENLISRGSFSTDEGLITAHASGINRIMAKHDLGYQLSPKEERIFAEFQFRHNVQRIAPSSLTAYPPEYGKPPWGDRGRITTVNLYGSETRFTLKNGFSDRLNGHLENGIQPTTVVGEHLSPVIQSFTMASLKSDVRNVQISGLGRPGKGSTGLGIRNDHRDAIDFTRVDFRDGTSQNFFTPSRYRDLALRNGLRDTNNSSYDNARLFIDNLIDPNTSGVFFSPFAYDTDLCGDTGYKDYLRAAPADDPEDPHWNHGHYATGGTYRSCN